MMTWSEVQELIRTTGAKNVRVCGPGTLGSVGTALWGNDGTILTVVPDIAAGYVRTDWDARNCTRGRNQ